MKSLIIILSVFYCSILLARSNSIMPYDEIELNRALFEFKEKLIQLGSPVDGGLVLYVTRLLEDHSTLIDSPQFIQHFRGLRQYLTGATAVDGNYSFKNWPFEGVSDGAVFGRLSFDSRYEFIRNSLGKILLKQEISDDDLYWFHVAVYQLSEPPFVSFSDLDLLKLYNVIFCSEEAIDAFNNSEMFNSNPDVIHSRADVIGALASFWIHAPGLVWEYFLPHYNGSLRKIAGVINSSDNRFDLMISDFLSDMGGGGVESSTNMYKFITVENNFISKISLSEDIVVSLEEVCYDELANMFFMSLGVDLSALVDFSKEDMLKLLVNLSAYHNSISRKVDNDISAYSPRAILINYFNRTN